MKFPYDMKHLLCLLGHSFQGADGCDWVAELESKADVICSEYRNLISAERLSKRKVKENDYELKKDEHQLHSGNWDWYSFVLKGKWQSDMEELCPTTSTLIKNIPGLMTGLPFSYCFFSSLQPNSKIDAHVAPCNLRVRCHLPLIVPKKQEDEVQVKCGLSVAGETVEWETGKGLLFDDAYEHRAWNLRESERVVLLVDVWNPEILPEEREHIKKMFASVNS
uniref:Aspartyl/asparaginy/proline hydroxylase domain-containing protein n=1 Tax=Aplanochytrium stocchinoi TaxID=215587 RepID=A0A7S3LP48_9STRA